MANPRADFLTPAELCRGADLLRPGSLTGKHVDPVAVAFIFTLHPYDGDEADIRASPEDRRLILWPAAMSVCTVPGRPAKCSVSGMPVPSFALAAPMESAGKKSR